MKRIKWIEETDETLLDLIFGCLISSFVFEMIGLFVVGNKLSYTIGIFLGTAVAIGMSISIQKSLEKCLLMDKGKGQRSMVIRSILRWIVMLAAVLAGLKFPFISFPGVILGIIGLKISAILHMYTNVYITKKIKKGR